MSHLSNRFALTAVAALTLSTVGVAVVGSTQPAVAAATVVQNYTAPGSYVVTVPPTATSVHLDALGAAGDAGGTAPSDFGDGGAGGHGDRDSEDVAIAPGAVIAPGSTFTVTVGALGGGGDGGDPAIAFGAPFAGAGGAGGGATSVTAQNGTVLIVAGGGGGGGGGGNGAPGGDGGTQFSGQGTSIDGVTAARGGQYGGVTCAAGAGLASYPGQAGETTQTDLSLGGGGGGAGSGFCGGGGGGSGDHGSGASNDGGGGGGGGSGGVGFYRQASATSSSSGTNTGNGSMSLTFDVAPAAATLSATSIDFGTQAVGTTSAPNYVTVANNGGQPLTFTALNAGGADPGDFSGTFGTCTSSLAPQASCKLGATFTPTAASPRTATLLVSDSAADSPQTITLSGNPAPATAKLSATAIDFGIQAVGTTSAPGYVTVTNDGGQPLTFTALNAGGADPGDFSGTFGTCTSSLAPQASCKLGATFTPTAAGPRTATLLVSDSAADSPQTITLSGNPAPGTATLSATSIDFGTQAVGTTSAPGYVTVTNDGGQPLTFTALNAGGADPGDFSGTFGTCTSSLAPQASCKLGATFTPTAAGLRTATLLVSDSAADSPQTITLSGNPAPGTATLSATSIDFGTQAVGTTSAPGYVTVTNNGGQPITFTGLGGGGANPGDFSGTFGNCPQSLAPNASCQLGATFTPTAAGPRSSTLQVVDSAGDSPQTITLTGNPAPGTATLSATHIDFGTQALGTTSAPGYVTVTNNGGQPITFTGLGGGGANPGDFSGTFGNCPQSLAPNASCQLGATFTPTAAGPRSSTLQVVDSAGDSPQTITLTGNPAPGTATLSATHIDFGTQALGTTSAPGYVTVTNNGGQPITFIGLGGGGANPGDFSGTFGNCPQSLAPNASCQLGATFTPTAAGPRSSTLQVVDSAGDSPQTITLTGNPAPGTATLSATHIDFGTQALGTTSAPGYVTVTNNGGQPITFIGLGGGGANPGDFSGTFGNCPQSLAPNASCKLGATFTPTAAGPRTSTLQVVDNAGDSPQTITLSGNPATVPTAPVIGPATAGDARATVAFTAPASDGGAPVKTYTVTATDVTHPVGGGQTATGTVSPITVTGLTNGDRYTFTVTAANSVGTGPASAASTPVTPIAAVLPLVIATHSPLPGGTVSTPYAATLTATGGTSPYAWSLATGSTFPGGLTLHHDGTLTGTPTAAGSRTFTVRVTDAAAHPQTASTNLTLTINPAPKLADLAVSLTHVGRFVTGHNGWYRVQITNTGAAATTHPTTVSTTLPRGLAPMWAAVSGWTCASHGQTGSCTHTGSIAAHQSSTILLLVRVTATAGTVLNTTMTVAPTDATPADNTSTDRVVVERK